VCVILVACTPNEPTTSTEFYLLVDVTASVEHSNTLFYLQSINEGIAQLKNVAFDRPTSNLFININATINEVAKNNADKQRVVISSDLLDNSPLFSAYSKNQMRELKKSPDFLINILEQHAPITQSLDKMDVIIVYQPNSRTDESFRLISSVFKNYLISKGANAVQIQANL